MRGDIPPRWTRGQTIGVLGFDSRRGLRIFLFTTSSRAALGPTQPLIQWVLWSLSLGIKWLGREADHSPPSSAEIKEWVELYLHSSNTPSWRGAQLKHRDILLPQYVFMLWRLVRHRVKFTLTFNRCIQSSEWHSSTLVKSLRENE
jgi:hypothetical protein